MALDRKRSSGPDYLTSCYKLSYPQQRNAFDFRA